MQCAGLAAAFVIICLAIGWAVRRRDRHSEWYRRLTDPGDRCANCGYDLRASRGRCPECGRPFWRFGD